MSILLANGLPLSALMAETDKPKGPRRDIGDRSAGADGTMRVTRQTRKRDLEFKSVPLTDAEAHAWESLLVGEGEVWSFDAAWGLFGRKGTGPAAGYSGATLVTAHPKFGDSNLSLAATSGTITWSAAAMNLFASAAAWSVMAWRYESAAWHHYVVRSDGTIWRDGSTSGGPTATWLTVNTTSGDVTIANATGSAVEYDDLVVLPFKVLDTWPAVFAAATGAYTPPPFLDLTGDQVPEQSSRRVLGEVTDELVKTAAGVKHVLDVKLLAR